MGKKIIISIDKNGLVDSHITGTSGRMCLKHLELLENVIGGEIISQQFTEEYYQTVEENISEEQILQNTK